MSIFAYFNIVKDEYNISSSKKIDVGFFKLTTPCLPFKPEKHPISQHSSNRNEIMNNHNLRTNGLNNNPRHSSGPSLKFPFLIGLHGETSPQKSLHYVTNM